MFVYDYFTTFVTMFPELNLPRYNFKLNSNNDSQRTQIFDRIRKKYVVLTPEEWVRQHFVHYLIDEKKYPESLVGVEITLIYNTLKKRADIIVYNTSGIVEIIVECKSPDIKISQDTFDQAARYNLKFRSNYLVVTNGLQHYCCAMDYEKNTYQFIENIPLKTG